MDKQKLKLIVQNLESLVECLKSEIYSEHSNVEVKDPQYENIANYLSDYDEIFYENDD
jgi:uncharacterized protein VirK/YbjX